MRYVTSFVLLSTTLFATSVRAVELEEAFCGCSDNQCCTLTPIDFFQTQTFSTGTSGNVVETIEYGNFTIAYEEDAVVKNNFNFFSISPIDCTQSQGFLFEQDGPAEPIAVATLIQSNPNNCLLNFSTLVSEDDLRKTVDLVLAFGGIPDEQVNVVTLETIVPYTEPTHTWVVEETQGDDSIVATSLNIQINADSNHNESCLEEANVENVFFQFLPGGDAPGTLETCKFPVDTMVVNEVENTVRIDYGLLQSEYQRCYRQDPEARGQDIVYTMEVRPVIGGCDYYDSYSTYIFTVTLDSQINVNATANVNSLVIDYLDDTLTLIPCTAELDGVNPLVPLARLDFIVEVNTAYGTEATSVVLTEKTLSEIPLDIVGDVNLTALPGTNTKARFRLRTSECLFVETQHSSQPATQANLIGCTVDYLQPMDIQALATYADGFTESNDIVGAERDVVFGSASAAECDGIIVPVSDVTQEYGAQLVLEDYNEQVSSLNLNNPIVARVELTNTDLAETTGVSVVLNDVIVTLTAATSGTVYRRTYSQANKITQMQFDFSPYEEDGHFCRFYDASSETCERFYNQTDEEAAYADNHWNAYLQYLYDVGPSGFFVTDADGRKYRGCQDLAVSGADSFVFTPSDWIFGEFPENTGTMEFQVTAFVRSCSGAPARLLRVSSGKIETGRELQNDLEDVAIVFNNVTIVNSQIVIGGGNAGSTVIPLEQSPLGIALISALAVVGAAVVWICCCGVPFAGAGRRIRIFEDAKERLEGRV